MRVLFCLMVAASPAFAEGKLLSVLELHNKLESADKKAVDPAYLSDRIRAEVLDAKLGVQVMTRENMLVLLQAQGKSLENCEGECEVDTGRRLGADYVVSGEVLRVGASLKVTLKLHDTHGGTLLGAVSASGLDVEALDGNLPAAVRRLVETLAPKAAAAAPAPGTPAPPPVESISMRVAAPPEGKWLLVTEDGSMLCTLPCSQRLARGSSYYAERDADRTSDRQRVALPSTTAFAPGRAAEAEYVSSRGSKNWGIALTVLGLASGAVGVGLLAARSSYGPTDTVPSPTPGIALVAGGGAALLGGIVLLIISHEEHYEGKLASGQASAALSPGALALRF